MKVFLSQNDGPSGAHIVVQDHVKHVVYYCINILSPLEVRYNIPPKACHQQLFLVSIANGNGDWVMLGKCKYNVM